MVLKDPVSIRSTRGDTIVQVRPWPGRDQAAYYVVSPDVLAELSDVEPPDPIVWPEALRRAILDRARDGGLDKGRVLYAYQSRYLFQRDRPVAALLLHVTGNGRVQVTRLGAVDDRVGAERDRILILLLACAQEVALRLGHRCLEWIVYNAATAREVHRKFDFARVRMGDRRCRELRRGQILMERCYDIEPQRGAGPDQPRRAKPSRRRTPF